MSRRTAIRPPPRRGADVVAAGGAETAKFRKHFASSPVATLLIKVLSPRALDVPPKPERRDRSTSERLPTRPATAQGQEQRRSKDCGRRIRPSGSEFGRFRQRAFELEPADVPVEAVEPDPVNTAAGIERDQPGDEAIETISSREPVQPPVPEQGTGELHDGEVVAGLLLVAH